MHFKTEILLPSATMRCTQSVRDIALRAVEEYSSLFEAYLYTVFVCSKTEHKLKTNFHLFKGHLYTKCAYSKTELESQGDNRSLERHCGQGNRPMSFRGVKRRGNPLNRNKNRLTIATNRISPHAYYRTENLRYQFKQGQELLPQLRQIVCLVKVGRDTHTRLE